MRLALLGLLLGTGCTGTPDDPPDTDTDPPVDTDAGPDRCAEPLAVTAPRERMVPWSVMQLAVTGGSGEHRFALRTADPDARVHPTLGRLFAGGAVGSTYTITVDDARCEQTAGLDLTLVAR